MYYAQPDSIAPGLSSPRFGGMDARAAMIPGGMVDGVSSLAQALLQAPMQRRMMQRKEEDAQREERFKQAQIDNMQAEQELNRTRVQNEGDYRKGEIDYRNNMLKERGREADQTNQRKGMEDLGTGIKNAWHLANQSVGTYLRGSGRGGAPTRESVISPYLEIDSPPDVYGHTHKMQRLKTPAEMDAERQARKYLKNGAPVTSSVVAPQADPNSVAANMASSAQVRANQRAQGLAQAPGDPAPLRSTAGLPDGAPPPAQPGPTTAIAPPRDAAGNVGQKVVRTSNMRQMIGTQYRSMDDAVAHAQSLGYNVVQDD